MEYHLIVEVEIRKGVGPDTFTKDHEVFFDDIEPEVSEDEIKEMAVKEAKQHFSNPKAQCPAFWIREVYFT